MAEDRKIQINEKEAEGVVGGYLWWTSWKAGNENPVNEAKAIYSYDDYASCIQWLDRNWVGERDVKCLEALVEQGLMRRG